MRMLRVDFFLFMVTLSNSDVVRNRRLKKICGTTKHDKLTCGIKNLINE